MFKRGNPYESKKEQSTFLAFLVWIGVGVNIFRIGILLYSPYLNIVNFLLSADVFAIFQYFIFGRLVRKHTNRIHGYIDERQFS